MGTDDESQREGHVNLAAMGDQMWFSKYVLEEFGAPRLAELSQCQVPELPEWPNHLGTAILNSIFVVGYHPKEIRRYLLNFIRRMEMAVGEYRLGRNELLSYVERLPSGNNHFLAALRALSRFEQSSAALYQAGILITCIMPDRLFTRDSGSPWERLNKIYNRSKHFEEGAALKGPAPATPVWLTNEGLECSDSVLTFIELHDIIVEMTKCAEAIATGRRA